VYRDELKDKNNIGQLCALLVISDCETSLYSVGKSHQKNILKCLSLLNKLVETAKVDIGPYNETAVHITTANFYIHTSPNYKSAKKLGEEALDKAVESSKKMKVNAFLLSHIYNLKYQLYKGQNPQLAKESLFKARELLKSSSMPNNGMLAFQNEKIAEYYEGEKDYKNANKHLNEAKIYNDLANNNEEKVMLLNNEIYYQSMQSEKEKKFLDEKINLLNNQKLLGFMIMLISVVCFLFIFLYLKKRRDSAIIAKIYAENTLNSTKEQLSSVKQEKTKLEKISLVNNLQLENKIETIKQITSNNNESDIKRIIKNTNNTDKNLDTLKVTINDIHPSFTKYLIKLSNNTLTDVDLKYCSYIYLRLDTASIASVLNVETKSVRMAKYRIKQKLKLEKEVDLNKFLQNFDSDSCGVL